MKLLIVEDDVAISETVRVAAMSIGVDPYSVESGEAAVRFSADQEFAIAIVDVNLPGMSGYEVCRRLREENSNLSILMLTSRGSEEDRLLGFDAGADDYMTKPFSVRELAARIRILGRRSEELRAATEKNSAVAKFPLQFGDLEIRPGERRVTRSGEIVPLTCLEFEVLVYLARHAGRAISREELVLAVWGYRHNDTAGIVNSLFSRLRHVLEPNPAKPRYILTVKGYGYRFVGPNEL